jgi:drug/metabolite transporter (DMT)-like permease
MLFIGIITGLGMAFFQSCSYLGSRFFYAKTGQGGLRLLAISHVQMGMVSALLLWIFWPSGTIPFAALAWVVVINSIAYMAGQAFFLQALNHANPSQIASLLALKLIGISLASLFILNIPITPYQVVGIILCLNAIFLLNSSRDKIPLRGLIYCLLALCGYSASDICIAIIVKQLAQAQVGNPSLTGTCVVYICTGIMGAAMLPFLPGSLKKIGPWLSALPFTAAWLIAINLLFQTFLLLGPVFGNILQTTRGIISVLLGKIVSRLGLKDLEEPMPRHAFVRRLGAALLMTAAVSLFVISDIWR